MYSPTPINFIRHLELPEWNEERRTGSCESVSVLDDRGGTGHFECMLCGLYWHHRTHALTHWDSDEHQRRVSFLSGVPMVYCVVCNTLPFSPDLHARTMGHIGGLASMGRAALPTDCTLRRVLICPDGRRRAEWFPLGLHDN